MKKHTLQHLLRQHWPLIVTLPAAIYCGKHFYNSRKISQAKLQAEPTSTYEIISMDPVIHIDNQNDNKMTIHIPQKAQGTLIQLRYTDLENSVIFDKNLQPHQLKSLLITIKAPKAIQLPILLNLHKNLNLEDMIQINSYPSLTVDYDYRDFNHRILHDAYKHRSAKKGW